MLCQSYNIDCNIQVVEVFSIMDAYFLQFAIKGPGVKIYEKLKWDQNIEKWLHKNEKLDLPCCACVLCMHARMYSSLPVSHVTYNAYPNTVSFCTVHNTHTHTQQGKSNFSFLCIHFSTFWSHFNLFIYFNMAPLLQTEGNMQPYTEYFNDDNIHCNQYCNFGKVQAVALWRWIIQTKTCWRK